jgi:hypothetical protein
LIFLILYVAVGHLKFIPNYVWLVSIKNSFLITIFGSNSNSFVGTTPPARSHPGANSKHQPDESVSKHQGSSKPTWLLALEIATGTMAGSIFLVAILTAFQKYNSKSSIIIPWKKSSSGKDHVTVSIGWVR